MTGHGDEEVAVASLKAGALDYFVNSGKMFKDMPHIAGLVLRKLNDIETAKIKSLKLIVCSKTSK